jgi:catechol 2,3-dioxygenase-like lactoylglutathione lyase family enzyme
MTIVLDHTIVRARDKGRSARFFADLLGLDVGEPSGPFAPVRVNDDLTLAFDDRHEFQVGHYAFAVDDATFDAALALCEGSTVDFGSAPGLSDRAIGHRADKRVVYIRDSDGNSYELLTAVR